MALFGRDYDRDFNRGYRGENWAGNRSYYSRTGAAPLNNPRFGGTYDRDFGWRGSTRYGSEFTAAGYDRGYKSRWETDYGDPFGDRQQNTPMRVIREQHGGYDRGFRSPYDRDFGGSPYPYGYRPYSARAGYDRGFSNRGYGTYGRRDNSWF